MDTIKQRIAIAKTQGIDICPWCYHVIDPDCCHCGAPMDRHGYDDGHSGVPMGCTCGYDKAEVMKAAEPECPDYLGDLNAMHEAEKTLKDDCDYAWILAGVCGYKHDPGEERNGHLHLCVSAFAAQRAEAFLRTLNLWAES